MFNEFVIWVLGPGKLQWSPGDMNGWKAVVSLLGTLAVQNPNFRVVVKGDCPSPPFTYDNARSFFNIYFPVVSLKGLARFEHVRHVDFLRRELRSL